MNSKFHDQNPWGKGIHDCECKQLTHSPKLIVLTGGPSAGKTAILEMVLKTFCPHVTVIPEAAGIVFGGGFFAEKLYRQKRGSKGNF